MGEQSVRVDGIADSGRTDFVYNVTIEDDHTYFVGKDEWRFNVWAHNAKYANSKMGQNGEDAARDLLAERGWKVVHTLGHGRNDIDLMAEKVIGGKLHTIIVEVKVNGSSTSKLQRLGADAYAQDVLRRLGRLPSLSPEARIARNTLERIILDGKQIHGIVIRFDWSSVSNNLSTTIKRWIIGVKYNEEKVVI